MTRAGALKPASARVFKRGGRADVKVLPPPATEIPPVPVEVGEYAVGVWREFWASDVSGLAAARSNPAALERLRHWIWCVHSREVIRRVLETSPVSEGSMGQFVAHPLWMVWQKLNREIEVAEAHFGMTPLAKMRLTGALDQAEQAETNIKARRNIKPLPLEPRRK